MRSVSLFFRGDGNGRSCTAFISGLAPLCLFQFFSSLFGEFVDFTWSCRPFLPPNPTTHSPISLPGRIDASYSHALWLLSLLHTIHFTREKDGIQAMLALRRCNLSKTIPLLTRLSSSSVKA